MTAKYLPLVALLATNVAVAGQSRPASEFAGTWDLACTSAHLTLHVALAGGSATGSGSWDERVVTPLDCDGIDEDEQAALHAELYATCLGSGLPALGCDAVAGDLTAAVAAFNDDTVAFIPSAVTMRVGTYGWFWSGLVGLYPMVGTHTFEDATRSVTYVLDNNDGPRGSFGAAGIAVRDAGSSDWHACADAGTAAIEGRIAPSAGFALSAKMGVNRSLLCLATDGALWVSGSVGVTFEASVTGTRR